MLLQQIVTMCCSTGQFANSDQQTVVNYFDLICLEEFDVDFHLLDQRILDVLVQVYLAPILVPVEIFQGNLGINHVVRLLPRGTAKFTTLQIIAYLNVQLCVEHVRHDDEVVSLEIHMSFGLILDLMQAQEASDQGLRVAQDVLIIIFQDAPKALVLLVVDCL